MGEEYGLFGDQTHPGAAVGWTHLALRRFTESYTSLVARLEAPTAPEEAPPLDPYAVERAYRFHRARRAAREARHRERQYAGLRFWFVLAIVLVAAAFLAARTLGEIEQLFGL
jgi:hypothetical protein